MIRVRPGEPADLERIKDIAASAAGAAQWLADEYGRLFALQGVQARKVLVAEDDGMVQGFIVGRCVDREWEIENIAVSPARQRRGLGSMLLEGFLRLARARQGTNVFLEVRKSNQAARLLYEKAGFVEAGRRKDYYRQPDEDALVLRFSFL
jgi:ribosomal-protein-alanine N-acetyltransferase